MTSKPYDHVVTRHDRYVIGRIRKVAGSFYSHVGIWDTKDAPVLDVPGAVQMAWTPDGAQVGVWREVQSGKTNHVFERYSFPEGKRLSTLDLVRCDIVEPIAIEFIKKYRGAVAKLLGGDCGGAVTLYVKWDGAADQIVDKYAAMGKPTPPPKPATEAKQTKSPARLRELAAMDPKLARLTARNKASPALLLVDLATHADVETRRGVAQNAAVPLATLLVLATDKDARVRQSAAVALGRTAGAPAAIYEQLARDKNKDVRNYIAYGAQTPAAVRMLLADDPDESVRLTLASRATSSAVLRKLADDPSPKVRAWIETYHADLQRRA